jgi:hypothetical protein
MTEEFITMDLETRDRDNEKIPYCVSMYSRFGQLAKSFYLSDYKNSDLMLEDSIKHLMSRKYDNYKVYLHNFSYFDGVFLLRILSNIRREKEKIKITPTINEGRLIDVKFTYFYKDKTEYTLYFRDSYLILPSSLAKLAKIFGVENKGVFPYNFIIHSPIE